MSDETTTTSTVESATPPSDAIQLTEARAANKSAWDKAADGGGSADVMLEYTARDLHLKDQLEKLAASTGEAPRLSDDPRERALGLPAPEPSNPEALVQQFERRGETLTVEGMGMARAIAGILPAEMLLEGETVMRELWGMEAAARLDPGSEDRAVLELDPDDVALFRILYDQLPPTQQRYLAAHHLQYHQPAVQRIARAAEKWLGTDAGIRWTLSGGSMIRQRFEREAAADYLRIAEEQGLGH